MAGGVQDAVDRNGTLSVDTGNHQAITIVGRTVPDYWRTTLDPNPEGSSLSAAPLLPVGLIQRSRPATGFLPLHYDAQHAGVDVDVPLRDAWLYELGHLGGGECRSRRIEKLQHLDVVHREVRRSLADRVGLRLQARHSGKAYEVARVEHTLDESDEFGGSVLRTTRLQLLH